MQYLGWNQHQHFSAHVQKGNTKFSLSNVAFSFRSYQNWILLSWWSWQTISTHNSASPNICQQLFFSLLLNKYFLTALCWDLWIIMAFLSRAKKIWWWAFSDTFMSINQKTVVRVQALESTFFSDLAVYRIPWQLKSMILSVY